jgi:hypothetical protein
MIKMGIHNFGYLKLKSNIFSEDLACRVKRGEIRG